MCSGRTSPMSATPGRRSTDLFACCPHAALIPPDISPRTFPPTAVRGCAARRSRGGCSIFPRWRPWWRPRRSVPAASAPPAAMACCSAACCSPAAKTRSNCRRRLRVRRRQRQALASHDLLRMRCAAVTLCAANSLPHSCHRVAPSCLPEPPWMAWPAAAAPSSPRAMPAASQLPPCHQILAIPSRPHRLLPLPGEAWPPAERAAKMGAVRLVASLFRAGAIGAPVIHSCLGELLRPHAHQARREGGCGGCTCFSLEGRRLGGGRIEGER